MSLLHSLKSIDAELAEKLLADEKFRRRYIRFWAQTEVASEIRTLRKKRKLRQAQLAALINTGQSAISRIEKADYDGWTFKTLISIAEVLQARLRITFEPIEQIAGNYKASATENVEFEEEADYTDADLSDGSDTGSVFNDPIGLMSQADTFR